MLEKLQEPMPLAARAAMSECHFRLVFAQEAGLTSSAFLDLARLDGARRLFE